MATRPTLRTTSSALAYIDVSSIIDHIHLTILLEICCVSMSLSLIKDEVQNRVGACAELEIRAGHVSHASSNQAISQRNTTFKKERQNN
jgi:hypothetical protein